jgi:hypothetical protein
MQDIAAETKKRGPSSRVLQEVIRQAPAEYVTVGWLTSTVEQSASKNDCVSHRSRRERGSSITYRIY